MCRAAIAQTVHHSIANTLESTRRFTADEKKLVELGTPIVWSLARSTARITGRLESDLVGVGVDTLIRLVQRFDPSRGVPFQAFAIVRLRGAMMDLHRSDRRSGSRQRLFSDRLASAEEILRWVNGGQDDSVANPEAAIIDQHELVRRAQLIQALVEELTDAERSVVRWLYWEEQTLDQVAKRLGVAKKTAWRTHARAKRKLQQRWYSRASRMGVF